MLYSADALSWLRKYKHKWMDTYKEKIEVSLESVLEQTLKPQRTTEEDRVCELYLHVFIVQCSTDKGDNSYQKY